MESFWPGFFQKKDLFATRQTSHCPLWFSLTHPAPLGLVAMVQTWPRLRLYTFLPDRSVPGSSRENAPGWGPSITSSPILAGPSMVLGADFSPRRFSIGDSRQEGSPLTDGGHDPSRLELWKLWVWPLMGHNS